MSALMACPADQAAGPAAMLAAMAFEAGVFMQ
jgi:hypothetical protein